MKTTPFPIPQDPPQPLPSCSRPAVDEQEQGWILLTGPQVLGEIMLDIIAAHANRSRVRVIDAQARQLSVLDWFEQIGRLGVDWRAEKRIKLLRADNCAHLLSILEQTRLETLPTVVLDLLGPFQDDRMAWPVRKDLLKRCLVQLHRLGRSDGLLVELRLPAEDEQAAWSLFEMVENAVPASSRIELVMPNPPAPSRG